MQLVMSLEGSTYQSDVVQELVDLADFLRLRDIGPNDIKRNTPWLPKQIINMYSKTGEGTISFASPISHVTPVIDKRRK